MRDLFEDRYVVGVLRVEEARGGRNRCGISERKSVAGSWRVEWIGRRSVFVHACHRHVYERSCPHTNDHGIMTLLLM